MLLPEQRNGRCQSSGDVTTGTLYRVYIRSDIAKEHILRYDVRTLRNESQASSLYGAGQLTRFKMGMDELGDWF